MMRLKLGVILMQLRFHQNNVAHLGYGFETLFLFVICVKRLSRSIEENIVAGFAHPNYDENSVALSPGQIIDAASPPVP
jgi:hypothetical protein